MSLTQLPAQATQLSLYICPRIDLVVTPEGLPLAYAVLPGNTADQTTLRGFLERDGKLYAT
jgi:hypothetical protein